MDKKLVYISGAITGDPNYEKKFYAAEKWLRRNMKNAEGFINPVRLGRFLESEKYAERGSLKYSEYFEKDIKNLLHCDVIVLLPDFRKSPGAMCELNIACCLEKEIVMMTEDELKEAMETR